MIFQGFVYLVLLAISCGYASIFGGRTGKAGAAIFVAASFLTLFAATRDPSFLTASVGVLLVDITCLLALLLLAMNSNRHWPIWAMGFQIAAVISHIGTVLAPGILPKAYYALITFWSIPILVVMVAGTTLDRSHERQQRGHS